MCRNIPRLVQQVAGSCCYTLRNNGSSITDLTNQSVPRGRPRQKKRKRGGEKIDRLYRWLEKSNQQQTCEKKAGESGGGEGRSLHTGETRESSALRMTGRVPPAPSENPDVYLFMVPHVQERSELCG